MKLETVETGNPRYILGVSDEPKQMLQPIAGYVHEPLLPLEKACEPLLDLVDRLEAHIWIAKENTKNPTGGLTPDESAAIHLYTMEWDSDPKKPRGSLYAQLNRTLKQVDRTKLRPWFRYLKLFLTALAKLPCEPHQTVWRGVRKDHSVDYPPGAQVTWWAFSSCTTSLSVLESDLYLGNVGTRTLFSIETINGRTIRAHSHFTTEDEILLLPGTYLEVKSRLNPATDLYIVHLQQKVPPHVLLEPPFPDAQLFPCHQHHHFHKDDSLSSDDKKKNRPWYKRKKFIFTGILAILLVIFIVLLTTLLATRKKNDETVSTLTTTLLPKYDSNISVFTPVSIAIAFYSFDNTVLDLYCLRDGKINKEAERYTNGYVAPGEALMFNRSISSVVSVMNPFNFNNQTFTIEAFILLMNGSLNASLIQFSSGMSINIESVRLTFVINENYRIVSTSTIPLNTWCHIAVVYNKASGSSSIYIDGTVEKQLGYVSNDVNQNANVTITIGSGFTGAIDQLSISSTAKSNDQILWDATVAAYYPLDGPTNNALLLDYGPNCRNASSAGARPTVGQVRTALTFNISGSYYEANAFPVLDIPDHAFTVAIWIRPDNQSGIFLTIANSKSCLLVLGIRTNDNRLVAYLPNATSTNIGVSLLGSTMTSNRWVHVAFTWSITNQAQLYKETAWQGRNSSAVKLNNNSGEPMTITLGMYRGTANCSGGDGLDVSNQFIGILDEFYVFSRELRQNEIERLNLTTNSYEDLPE